MTDTTPQAVVETPAPDANAAPAASADPSPAAVDTSDKSDAPKKDGSQKRIDELTWHRRNAERRNRALESEVAELRSLLQQKPPQEQARPTAPKKLADFNYDEEAYQAHLEEVVAEKAAAKAEAKLRERQDRDSRERSHKENHTKFREREAKVRAELEDYEDFAYSAPIDEITDLIVAMDEGPRIAYYLGKNPETAARINSLPPHLAAVELGRLDQRLAFEREQAKAKPVSKAPPPPPKIDATEPAVDKDPSQMTDSEFAKWRKRQIAQRR
jgi:hypothetical protein